METSIVHQNDDMLTLTHATERDVDLLIIEELKCSPSFVCWFAGQVSAKTSERIDWSNSSVIHSKRRLHNRREIDIALNLKGSASTTVILVENKLDSAPQPMQAESYREEAAIIVGQCEAASAYTVLVAPMAYIRASKVFADKFDACVSYETIESFLNSRVSEESGELAARLRHRQSLLNQAITKARRGYEAVPLAPIQAFNANYVSLLKSEHIDLPPGPSMLKEGRPGESKTMIFAPHALPKWPCLPQTRLVHQLREGNANINFYSWGSQFSRLAAVIATDLKGTPYRPVPTVNKRLGGNSGLMLVVDTPPIDNLDSFDVQRDAIIAGARATAALRSWFASNRKVIERWAAIVAI